MAVKKQRRRSRSKCGGRGGRDRRSCRL